MKLMAHLWPPNAEALPVGHPDLSQVLALADVPVVQGGLAGSVGQLGQRIGTAIGTAVALSLFYSTIYNGEGQAGRVDVFHAAYAAGMAAVGALLLLALVIGLVDLRQRQADRRR